MSSYPSDERAIPGFLTRFDAWSRALLAQPRTFEPGITKMVDIAAASAAVHEARRALPQPATIHGLYPGFESLGGAYAAADAEGGGILMAVADLAAREASDAVHGRALNWQSALHLYGECILAPMIELLAEAGSTGGQYLCRWEFSETPCDETGEPIEGAEEILRSFPVGPDLPDGFEEARLTICEDGAPDATLVKQVWFDIKALQDMMEEREKLADAARRGEAGR